MTNNLSYSSVLLDEPLKGGSYNFQLPTRATRLEPVFTITFEINDTDLPKSIFNLSLNPVLANKIEVLDINRQYNFDANGVCLFENEKFGDYFIEGEIKLPELSTQLDGMSCFLRITYGNRAEALHYIKGNFKLTELIN